MRYTTDEIPYPLYGQRSYRIEKDLSDPHRPLQRHIWTRDNGEVYVEEWIRSLSRGHEDEIAHGYRPIEQE